MAQFTCEICGAEFEQKSRYERHMATSHPARAPSAADLEKAIKGVSFPATRDDLVEHFGSQGDIATILSTLPDKEYQDAADVARAFGEVRSHRKKPDDQPSKKGGARAMEAPSAARIASLFEGMDFPASGEDLKNHAQERANDDEMQVIEKFGDRTYRSMADVTKEIGRVT